MSRRPLAACKAYESAGYLMRCGIREGLLILQPDFRALREIDLSGGPRPGSSVASFRRVGRETELTISGAEVRRYRRGALSDSMRRRSARRDMASLIERLKDYPRAG